MKARIPSTPRLQESLKEMAGIIVRHLATLPPDERKKRIAAVIEIVTKKEKE
jgi:hypothetical protein